MADDRVDQDVEQGTGDDIALGSAAFSFEMSTVVPRLTRNVKVLSREVPQQSNDSRANAILGKDFQDEIASYQEVIAGKLTRSECADI
jgi:hypothetical protein